MDAIVAVYSDWGIGADGTQPVVLKADRQHFVELTRGRTVIVGRRTLADFPGGRPLKGGRAQSSTARRSRTARSRRARFARMTPWFSADRASFAT